MVCETFCIPCIATLVVVPCAQNQPQNFHHIEAVRFWDGWNPGEGSNDIFHRFSRLDFPNLFSHVSHLPGPKARAQQILEKLPVARHSSKASKVHPETFEVLT